MPRPNWSRPVPRSLVIPDVMDLKTLADVRKLIEHLPRQFHTWQHVEAELNKAAAGGDTEQVYVALQMVLQLERVEYQVSEASR